MAAQSPPPTLLQLSHPGLAHKVSTIEQRRATYNSTSNSGVVATLHAPTSQSDAVQFHKGGMIVVDGRTGHYSFEFDNTSKTHSVYLDITYCSGDVRPVLLKLNGVQLSGSFCTTNTGGFDPRFYSHERFGPFYIKSRKNTLHVTTENYYFPHVHEIRVINATTATACTADEVTKPASSSTNRTWIAPPTSPLRKDLEEVLLRGFCSLEGTQEPNPRFVPDGNFYNAVNCNGLWVCASRQVKMVVLHTACELVCRYVPIEIRRACLQWRAPTGRPQGPFRLVILDPVTNQKAGDCPDFPDSWGGRNSTSNPACFTCASDLEWSRNKHNDDCAPHGELTVHEMTHLIDMVVRQQLDPFFFQQVDDVWQTNRSTYKKSYAESDRHEYLAEISTLFVGCRSANFKRGCHACTHSKSGCCGCATHQALPPGMGAVDFSNKSHLRTNDPDGYALLQSFLIEIRDPTDDTFWWQ